MTTTVASVSFILIAASELAQGSSYTIRPSPGTRLELLVAKTGLLKGKRHQFLFERYEGTLEYDPQSPQSSRVTMKIDSGSASCKDSWVSAKDLRKIQEMALNDMLDAAHHPEITFTSNSIRQMGEGRYEVQGALTIRGITKPAASQVSLKNRENGVLSFEGTSEIRLTDYGLKPPSAALGTIGTRNEMSFSFALIAAPGK